MLNRALGEHRNIQATDAPLEVEGEKLLRREVRLQAILHRPAAEIVKLRHREVTPLVEHGHPLPVGRILVLLEREERRRMHEIVDRKEVLSHLGIGGLIQIVEEVLTGLDGVVAGRHLDSLHLVSREEHLPLLKRHLGSEHVVHVLFLGNGRGVLHLGQVHESGAILAEAQGQGGQLPPRLDELRQNNTVTKGLQEHHVVLGAINDLSSEGLSTTGE